MDWVALNGGTQLESIARMIMESKPYYEADWPSER
jgi:hypothetical protein